MPRRHRRAPTLREVPGHRSAVVVPLQSEGLRGDRRGWPTTLWRAGSRCVPS